LLGFDLLSLDLFVFLEVTQSLFSHRLNHIVLIWILASIRSRLFRLLGLPRVVLLIIKFLIKLRFRERTTVLLYRCKTLVCWPRWAAERIQDWIGHSIPIKVMDLRVEALSGVQDVHHLNFCLLWQLLDHARVYTEVRH
jgi:hypothetical protein